MYKASLELSFFLLPSLSAEITGVHHHARYQASEHLSHGQALSCVALTPELKALFLLKLVRTDGDNTHTMCKWWKMPRAWGPGQMVGMSDSGWVQTGEISRRRCMRTRPALLGQVEIFRWKTTWGQGTLFLTPLICFISWCLLSPPYHTPKDFFNAKWAISLQP